MLTPAVAAGRETVGIMFREAPEPKFPFSGWVFLSENDFQNLSRGRGSLRFHDPLAVLRIAPEVAPYLDLPPGSKLKRVSRTTFEPFV